MFAAKSTGWFYNPAEHVGTMPSDAVEIDDEYHQELVDGLSAGQVLSWRDDGYPFLAEPPPPTPVQITASLTAAVQAHMDTQARALNYDDIKTAVTYADEPAVPKFQAEGQAMRAWRSLCWAHCYAVLDEVTAGNRAIQTAPELIAELPELVLPA